MWCWLESALGFHDPSHNDPLCLAIHPFTHVRVKCHEGHEGLAVRTPSVALPSIESSSLWPQSPLCLFACVWDRITLCSPGWHGIYYITQAALNSWRFSCLWLLSIGRGRRLTSFLGLSGSREVLIPAHECFLKWLYAFYNKHISLLSTHGSYLVPYSAGIQESGQMETPLWQVPPGNEWKGFIDAWNDLCLPVILPFIPDDRDFSSQRWYTAQ